MRARAELIPDEGRAAAGNDFFRSRPYLGAEGVTHTLQIIGGAVDLRAPVTVRPVQGSGESDAISPYGFPGFVGSHPTPIDPAEVDWSATGLVSVFIRHTLGEPPLAGAAARNVVQIADPALPPKTRGSDRNRINRNRREGYRVEVVPGPETSAAQRAGFLAAYEQTMRRTGAAARYRFDAAYFDRILGSSATWLALGHAPGGEVAAASLAAASDGFLHYYLSGSADASLRDSPMKNVVAALVELSAERGEPLNLGGGIARGDRLEEFKRGFANREQPWHVSEVVCDRVAYDRLSAGRERGTGFFPLYRAAG